MPMKILELHATTKIITKYVFVSSSETAGKNNVTYLKRDPHYDILNLSDI